MEEKTFLNEGGVTVTSARFIVPAQTYAMSGVTSVKAYREDPSRGGPILLVVIGIVAALAGAIFWGALFVVIGVVWGILQKSTHYVVLSSASGEAKALKSENGEFIGRVIGALNDVIVHRG